MGGGALGRGGYRCSNEEDEEDEEALEDEEEREDPSEDDDDDDADTAETAWPYDEAAAELLCQSPCRPLPPWCCCA